MDTNLLKEIQELLDNNIEVDEASIIYLDDDYLTIMINRHKLLLKELSKYGTV